MTISKTDEFVVELDGKTYRWMDHWIEDETYLIPPTNIGIRIRQSFITEQAPQLLANCPPDQLQAFNELLSSMGATEADYQSLGLH